MSAIHAQRVLAVDDQRVLATRRYVAVKHTRGVRLEAGSDVLCFPHDAHVSRCVSRELKRAGNTVCAGGHELPQEFLL